MLWTLGSLTPTSSVLSTSRIWGWTDCESHIDGFGSSSCPSYGLGKVPYLLFWDDQGQDNVCEQNAHSRICHVIMLSKNFLGPPAPKQFCSPNFDPVQFSHCLRTSGFYLWHRSVTEQFTGLWQAKEWKWKCFLKSDSRPPHWWPTPFEVKMLHFFVFTFPSSW